ncbi:hypothetical protein BGZ47_004714 [Haplosporangium gracile]|nr:hypothetical protein BGZ47_004714 [Haplosporangium gracile]
MSLFTIVAATVMVILSIVSSQTTTTITTVAACNACITSAGINAVPACKGLENTRAYPATGSTDQQKTCWCNLSANKAWADSCVKSNKCTAEPAHSLVQSIVSRIASQPGMCDNASVTRW